MMHSRWLRSWSLWARARRRTRTGRQRRRWHMSCQWGPRPCTASPSGTPLKHDTSISWKCPKKKCRLPVDSYLPQFKKSSNGASNSPRKGLHILNLHVNSYLPHLKSQMGQIDVFLKNPWDKIFIWTVFCPKSNLTELPDNLEWGLEMSSIRLLHILI